MLSTLLTSRSAHVAVIGDVMLDTYVTGHVDRVSPEAPVPVVRVVEERSTPGGAANVARNLAALGCSISLVGLIGDDTAGALLRDLLSAVDAIDASGLIRDPGRVTTRKTRIVGAHQQVVRLDNETAMHAAAHVEQELIDAAVAAIAAADLAIISDYAKGACSVAMLAQCIAAGRDHGVPVWIDPKRRDFAAYRGATLLTPNRSELSAATGLPCESDEEAEKAAAAAQEVSGADILLTRAEKGLSFFKPGDRAIHLPTTARQVFDVSGAGDTVIAALATAFVKGLPLLDALQFANLAAGLAVGKAGTAIVTLEELLNAGAQPTVPAEAPVLDRKALLAQRDRWRSAGLSIGFTNGCFDLLHPGHLAVLNGAAAECDRLIVGLNSDASVRRLKGPRRPIQDEISRARVLAGLRAVAAVSLFDEDTPLDLIEAIAPDVLVKGGDYRQEDVVGANTVSLRGGKLLLVPLVPNQSTTRLAERIRTDPVNSTAARPD